jgi:hypothetical protein
LKQKAKMEGGDLTGLDLDEERTCDRCRRHLDPGEQFTPLVIREGIFVVTGALCSACATEAGIEVLER